MSKLDGKIHPTIRGPLRAYVLDLLGTGLYGNTEGDVVRNLVREGVRKAITDKMIACRTFEVAQRSNHSRRIHGDGDRPVAPS